MEFIQSWPGSCARYPLPTPPRTTEQAKAAFDAGITHATHLFNAMSGLRHRDPGVVGAVFDDDRVRAELICDGFHIHPAVLRTAFQAAGGPCPGGQ